MRKFLIAILILPVLVIQSCREDIYIYPSESTPVAPGRSGEIVGFYLLNEGNMGSNRASIDFFEETSGTYIRNIYSERNPSAVKELGDVGNSMIIYGSKLYAMINCSHKVEVMDAASAKRIGQIDIPNCRFAAGEGHYIYVSSYVSPVQADPTAPRGAVFKVDTLSLKIVDRVEVGYQPEELAIVNGKIYVANSGGYRAPNYDRTVSVIDIDAFKVTGNIDVGINLNHISVDRRGLLYVTSRGDNGNTPPSLYVVDPVQEKTISHIDIPVSKIAISGDSAYYYGTERNEIAGYIRQSYGIINLTTSQTVETSIFKNPTVESIKMPYDIAIHPETGDIFLTDARNYVSSGRLHCFDKEGNLKWSQKTGDIPADIVFLKK